MRKSALFVIAAASMMMLASSANAAVLTHAGLAIWYDVRDNTATSVNGYSQQITGTPGAPYTRGQSLFANQKTTTFAFPILPGNGGGPGDAEVLRISPRLGTAPGDTFGPGHVFPSATKGAKIDVSVGRLYTYATVGSRSGPAAQVIGSLGLTKEIRRGNAATGGVTGGANGQNPIDSVSYTPDTALWSTSGVSSSVTVVTAGADFDISSKHVKVPVSGPPPVFNAAGGLVPSSVYRVATLTVTAGDRAAAPNHRATVYNLSEKVNNLLVTRVYNGAGGATPELPDFGYITSITGGANGERMTGSGWSGLGANQFIPEAGTTDGSTIGDTSASADAQIVIQRKFDFNNDGAVDFQDTPLYSAALANAANLRQRETYLADGRIDNAVDFQDTPQLTRALSVP